MKLSRNQMGKRSQEGQRPPTPKKLKLGKRIIKGPTFSILPLLLPQSSPVLSLITSTSTHGHQNFLLDLSSTSRYKLLLVASQSLRLLQATTPSGTIHIEETYAALMVLLKLHLNHP